MNLVQRIINSIFSKEVNQANASAESVWQTYLPNNKPITKPATTKELNEFAKTVSVVYSIILNVANDLASFDYGIYQKDPKTGVLIPVKDEILNPFNKFFTQPNGYQGFKEFITEFWMSFILYGNGWIHGIKANTGLYKGYYREFFCFPDTDIEIVTSRTDFRNPISNLYLSYDQRKFPLNYTDFLHHKIPNFDTTNAGANLRGRSPFASCTNEIDVFKNATETVLAMFQNQGHAGIITPETANLTLTEQNAVKDKFETLGKNRRNAFQFTNKVMVTNIPLKYTDIYKSPSDLAVNETMVNAMRMILNAFGLPSQFFNDTNSSTYNNLLEARKRIILDFCLPKVENFAQELNRWLFTEFNLKNPNLQLFCKVEKENHTVWQEYILEKMAKLKDITFLTPNEKRLYFGYEALPGLDNLTNTDNGN